jgi:MarC family membrane protein
MPLLSAVVLLFLVMDPIGNVPLFVAALSKVSAARRFRVLVRELLIALAALLLFLFIGRHVLDVLQVSEPALSVAGGVVLFLIAVRMIFPSPEGMFGRSPDGEPFVVPLAIPLIAGPSTLATILLLVAREPESLLRWLLAVTCAWLAGSAILLLSAPLSRLLGSRGLIAAERLMGMILTIIAVQMFLTGLGKFLGL